MEGLRQLNLTSGELALIVSAARNRQKNGCLSADIGGGCLVIGWQQVTYFSEKPFTRTQWRKFHYGE